MAEEQSSPPVIAWLETKEGGEVFRLAREGDCRIGRSQQNCIILDDKKVSRHHAEIRAQAGLGYLIFDLGSRNGTQVNGRRIHRPTLLNDRDVLELGALFENETFYIPERIIAAFGGEPRQSVQQS